MGVVVTIFMIVFFVLALGLVGVNVWSSRKNRDIAQSSVMIPFSATIDPTTGQPGSFVTASGAPQLSCPAGSKINIIGAFFDVYDPYNECVVSETQVSPLLTYTCDPSAESQAQCSSSVDCWDGAGTNPYTCNSSGKCQLITNFPATVACPTGMAAIPYGSSGGYYCANPDVCLPNNDGSVNLPNATCTPLNTTDQCANRDASVGVAAKCNGREVCSDLSMSDFGDYPCPGLAPQQCISSFNSDGTPNWVGGRIGYCGLPYAPGFNGGVPAGSSTSNASPANANLGYTMHGIYTCIPA